jgi:hypothetical protein
MSRIADPSAFPELQYLTAFPEPQNNQHSQNCAVQQHFQHAYPDSSCMPVGLKTFLQVEKFTAVPKL